MDLQEDVMGNWKEILKTPPKEYRAIPFWSWNDMLDPQEVRWQVDEMKKAGLGGYFMHARSGLKTPYMGEDWMEAIAAGIDEGKKEGIAPWLYDEDGWPSGFAGGDIPALGEEYHQKWLECKEVSKAELTTNHRTVGIYTVDTQTGAYTLVQDDKLLAALPENTALIHIFYDVNPYYVDTLDQKVIRAFIDSTHEAYKQKFGHEFGTSVPGIFTDEPQYKGYTGPWSLALPRIFETLNGYCLQPVLPALFFDVKDHSSVRYDFWKTVSYMFSTAFSKQISDWCQKNGLIHTGHVVSEESLVAQLVNNGGCMPFYQYMQLPGIDWLCRWIGTPITPKQLASVAHQLGKKYTISEMFGCSGWNISFEELKWVAEWQYVLGVNLMCQHLEWYSMKGLRKRDYPPSLYYQQPWWGDYKLFNDYFARLGVLLSEGRHNADILVLHPLRSLWAVYKPGPGQECWEVDNAFAQLSTWLLESHLDFDYGDEEIINQYGSVECGRFIIGQASYRVVILPPAISLDNRTIALLEQFADTGGKIISVGRFPSLCEGRPTNRLDALRKKVKTVTQDKAAIRNAVVRSHAPAILIHEPCGEDAAPVYYQYRSMDHGEQVLFVVNTSTDRTIDTRIGVHGQWNIERCVLENGEYEKYTGTINEGRTWINVKFLPMQSYVFVLRQGMPAVYQAPPAVCGDIRNSLMLQEEWEVKVGDHNSLTLDYAYLSIDGGEWSEKTPTIEIQEKLLRLGRSADIALRFEFEVGDGLDSVNEMYLAMEEPEQFSIEINGEVLPYQDCGWWRDKCLRKISIKPCVQTGVNTILLRMHFTCSEKVYKLLTTPGVHEAELNKITYDAEIESIYVIGDFGVYSKSEYTQGERKAVFTDGPFVIGKKPIQLRTGDTVPQGLAFYAGNLQLKQEVMLPAIQQGQSIVLDMGTKPSAVIYKVRVNGEHAGTVTWAPYQVDITSYVKPGTNTISIELMGSCRNLLGPHHHVLGELHAVGPSSFTSKKGWIEWNLEDPNIWRDRYCFVRFGLEENPVLQVYQG